MDTVDVIIVGAGVIGLSVGAQISAAYPDKTVVLLEQHSRFGQETSSRNSEVIHGGMYYPTESLKAQMCVEGNRQLYEFCQTHHIPHSRIGKLIIARTPDELPAIEAIFHQGMKNGVSDLQLLSQAEVQQMEPAITAVGAVYSPSTGIIDSHRLMACLEQQIHQQEGMIAYQHKVTAIQIHPDGYEVCFEDPQKRKDSLLGTWLINCAGLYADQLAAMAGIDIEAAGYVQQPVKGEYFSLASAKAALFSHLIYPPPMHGLVGLGIHTVKDLNGQARLGPNAFPVSDISSQSAYDVDPSHHQEFFQAASTYLPFLQPDDIAPDMAGIRPKLRSASHGPADFIIREESDRHLPRLINLVGIESPGLTACLAIGRYVTNILR